MSNGGADLAATLRQNKSDRTTTRNTMQSVMGFDAETKHDPANGQFTAGGGGSSGKGKGQYGEHPHHKLGKVKVYIPTKEEASESAGEHTSGGSSSSSKGGSSFKKGKNVRVKNTGISKLSVVPGATGRVIGPGHEAGTVMVDYGRGKTRIHKESELEED